MFGIFSDELFVDQWKAIEILNRSDPAGINFLFLKEVAIIRNRPGSISYQLPHSPVAERMKLLDGKIRNAALPG
jgi:hypothetical protein